MYYNIYNIPYSREISKAFFVSSSPSTSVMPIEVDNDNDDDDTLRCI